MGSGSHKPLTITVPMQATPAAPGTPTWKYRQHTETISNSSNGKKDGILYGPLLNNLRITSSDTV